MSTNPETQDTSAAASPQAQAPQTVVQSPMTAKLQADPHYWRFLVFFLVIISALGSFVNDMYTPALPAMTRFFGCSIPLAQMGLTMGMIGLALGQIILGPVSDTYGRKPVLIGSISLFIVAAVASVFSPNIHVFNLCRLFQGLGASGGYFLARTIPADVYSGRNLAKLMAIVGAINGFAPASAPVIGGVTADHFGWRGVFVVLAVFAALILFLSPYMKETHPRAASTSGIFSRAVGGYKRLLSNYRFMIHVSFKGTALGLLFAYISATPFILQTHYGLSQTVYGLVIGANSIFVAAGSALALKFHPLKNAAWIGAVVVAAGAAGQAVALWRIDSLVVFEIFMCAMLFGLGLIFATTNTLAMNEGRMEAGEASSVLGVSGYVVGAIVSPLVGMGNILHSAAIVFVAVTAVMCIFAILSKKIAPDL